VNRAGIRPVSCCLVEIYTGLGYYTVYSGNSLLLFWGQPFSPIFKSQDLDPWRWDRQVVPEYW